MKVPRTEAATVLAQVLSEGHPLDEALRRSAEKLGAQERGWLWDVCSGVLRFRPRLDLALDSLSLKKKPSGRLRRYLLIAAYQIFFQDSVQPERVVDETVESIKKREGSPPANFANALLRKLLPQKALWRELPWPADDLQGEKLRAWTCLPEWFQARLERQRGRDFTLRFAAQSLSRPETWVRAHGAAGLAGPAFRAGPVKGAARVEMTEGFEKLPGFQEGAFYAQDISSQLAVQAVIETLPKKGRVLDLCAAPGGKAFHLADEGWEVTATDLSARRLERLKENALRLGSKVRVTAHEDVLQGGEKFDLVWVDAPCSGSGIIRRHPDAKYLHDEKQLAELKKTQRELLAQAQSFVAPGGSLVYSVCSVFTDEAEEPVAEFLRGHPSFQQTQSKLLVPQEEPSPDGFYFAVLKRND